MSRLIRPVFRVLVSVLPGAYNASARNLRPHARGSARGSVIEARTVGADGVPRLAEAWKSPDARYLV
jgi:hypothetical protein